jgi:uncharacterized protein DUF4412
MRLSPYACSLLVLVAVPAAAQDLTIVSKTTRDGGAPTTVTGYLTSDRVRIADPAGMEFIMDLKSAQTTVLDAKKKEYFVVTRQDMEQLRAKVSAQMNSPEMKRAQEQMQQQMKNAPPELRKQMQAAMGAAMGGMAASVNVARTGTTRKIAGYTCENWAITMGELTKTEQCVSTDLPIPIVTWNAYQDYAESMRSLTAAAGPMGKGIADMAEKLKQIKGFPLAVTTTTNIMGRTSSHSSEVVEVRKGAVPASAFEIPAGYKKIENPMLQGLQSMPKR